MKPAAVSAFSRQMSAVIVWQEFNDCNNKNFDRSCVLLSLDTSLGSVDAKSLCRYLLFGHKFVISENRGFCHVTSTIAPIDIRIKYRVHLSNALTQVRVESNLEDLFLTRSHSHIQIHDIITSPVAQQWSPVGGGGGCGRYEHRYIGYCSYVTATS